MKAKHKSAADDLQKSIWQKHTEEISINRGMLDSPAFFQTELASLMALMSRQDIKSIEVGCEFGITSYLLPRTFEKSFVDYNQDALDKCKQLGKITGNMGGYYILCDMFNMDQMHAGKYDLVFNAGVIEHYEMADRVRLIESMRQLAKDDGVVVIAFPNHYSFPYRLAYRLMVLLGVWKFPKEVKLYDLSKEAAASGMEQVVRLTISKRSLFSWLDPKPFILFKAVLKLFDKINSFEGYLTCIILRKKTVVNG